ncbi:OmpA family protein [Terricaulis sp.]|uniref:OmpA family protein n=1 Tax=Terricaulis sp. TaxID=2768686 RepID=UPI003782EE8B
MTGKASRTLLLALLASAGSATVAHATEGWYGRLDAGYSFESTVDDGTEFDLDDNWMGSVGLGYATAGNFRFEGEYSYRQNEVEIVGQDVTTQALMLNAYYDFNRGGRFEPYVGVGAGYSNLDVEGAGDENSWAWQAMAGVAIGLTDRLDLDIGYRYFDVPEADFSGFDVEEKHQAVTVGLRWQFQAAEPPPPAYTPPPPPAYTPPPPPPPPQAATCPQADFVVYFEWDRSNLNQSALETIDSAVQRARACNLGSVVVVGHTDTSGSTQYNIGLSERRAAVVRDALTARGIPAGAIQTEARGENDLARPTRDGIREPLNRRTAVTISFR